MEAIILGTPTNPQVLLRFGFTARHPRGKTMQEWVKSLPGRTFDKALGGWLVTGTGPDPDKVFQDAGFTLNFAGIDPASPLHGISTLNDMVTPVARLSSSGRRVLIRHRFLGYEKTLELLGQGASWDRGHGRFVVPLTDILIGGQPRPGIIHDPAALDAAAALLARVFTAPEHAEVVAAAGSAARPEDLSDEQLAQLRSINGVLPEWFGLPLFPFQEVGALAVAAGHTGLFDSMRVGKALPVWENVLTPTGFTVMGKLRVDDLVVGRNGQPTKVTGVFPQGKRLMYTVKLADGRQVKADGEHLWRVNGRVMTTLQIQEGLSARVRFALPALTAPVPFNEEDVRSAAMSAEAGKQLPYGYWETAESWRHASVSSRRQLIDAAATSRLAVHAKNGSVIWTLRSLRTAGGMADIIRSLGREATVVSGADHHTLTMHPKNAVPGIVAVQEAFEAEAVCIEVAASDHLFITRDYIVTHNTRTALAAATLLKSHRTLIISPPLVVTNWAVNAEESRLATRGGKTEGKVVTFRAGRKEPELPETGIVIVADSLAAARPELRAKLALWKPQVTILDEAHREGTYGSKRTEAVLDLAWATEKRAIALTGTPLFSSPQELVPLLEFTGHLGPLFGGVDQFLTEFTTRDKWGRNHPKKTALPGLQQVLRRHFWVRRTKEQVGIGMPFVHGPLVVDVDLKLFRDAHAEVSDKVDDWIDDFIAAKQTEGAEVAWPNDEDIELWAKENIGLISGLRRAAGLAKVPGSIELIVEHVKATASTSNDEQGRPIYDRPLIVWTHHRDVTEAMATALGGAVEDAAMIIGGMSMTKKDATVAAFQRGEIPVLACSIIAAGVGIDLTRSADVLFVETDWTPGNVQQALDRVQGVNQTKNVMAQTLIATGTLDERIQKVQNTKGKTLEAVLGGEHDVSVAENLEDLRGASSIVIDLVKVALQKRKARGGPSRGRS